MRKWGHWDAFDPGPGPHLEEGLGYTVRQGHFPEWLNGYLLRVGPGKFEFGKDK